MIRAQNKVNDSTFPGKWISLVEKKQNKSVLKSLKKFEYMGQRAVHQIDRRNADLNV